MADTEVKSMLAALSTLTVRVGKLEPPKGHLVYTNAELKELLGVGDKLIKKYRDEGLLGFSRVGDKYFYSEKDIVKFLEINHFEAFAEC